MGPSAPRVLSIDPRDQLVHEDGTYDIEDSLESTSNLPIFSAPCIPFLFILASCFHERWDNVLRTPDTALEKRHT
jgi:hypothetical protein